MKYQPFLAILLLTSCTPKSQKDAIHQMFHTVLNIPSLTFSSSQNTFFLKLIISYPSTWQTYILPLRGSLNVFLFDPFGYLVEFKNSIKDPKSYVMLFLTDVCNQHRKIFITLLHFAMVSTLSRKLLFSVIKYFEMMCCYF